MSLMVSRPRAAPCVSPLTALRRDTRDAPYASGGAFHGVRVVGPSGVLLPCSAFAAHLPLSRADHVFEVHFKKDALELRLTLCAPQERTELADTSFQLDLGAINPTDDTTDAGYKARLFNLGFLWDPTVADTDDEMLIALQDFQAEYSLTISGQLDEATKAHLTQTYGS